MINETTTPTSVLNVPVSPANVVNNTTLDVGVTNLVSNVAVPTNEGFIATRWMDFEETWDEMEMSWNEVTDVTKVTNL
jgi:hypothetical protein